MTHQELSALASEVKQLERERARIDDQVARIGLILIESYPADDRPDLVCTLLENIDNLV